MSSASDISSQSDEGEYSQSPSDHSSSISDNSDEISEDYLSSASSSDEGENSSFLSSEPSDDEKDAPQSGSDDEKREMVVEEANTPAGTPIDDKDVWAVVEAYCKDHKFVSHQIDAFNNFVEVLLPKIIEQNSKIDIKYPDGNTMTVYFSNLFVSYPNFVDIDRKDHKITPKECRDRDITYASTMFVDIKIVKPNGDIKEVPKFCIGRLPIMTLSNKCNISKVAKDDLFKLGECPMDVGGIFYIGGSPKNVIPQERTSFNKPYIFGNKKKPPTFQYYAEVRSSALNGSHTTTTQIGYLVEKMYERFYIVLPYIKNPIPIGIIFKAMGILEEKDIVKYISTDEKYLEKLAQTLEQSYPCKTQEDAFFFIGKKGKKFDESAEKNVAKENGSGDEEDLEEKNNDKNSKEERSKKEKEDAISYAKHLLKVELFPHIGKDYNKKLYYIGDMICKILKILVIKDEYKGTEKWEEYEDRLLENRDSYANKRIDCVDVLLNNLFYTVWKKFRVDCQVACEKIISKNTRDIDPIAYLKEMTITKKLMKCLSTGNWSGTRKTNEKKNGISQQYEKYNFNGSISILRKISAPIGKEGKIIKPRRIDETSNKFICPAETPEGQSCLTAGTKVLMYDHSLKNIEDLKNGDGVISVDPETLKISTTFIKNFFSKTSEKLFNITTRMGNTITATHDHPFLVYFEGGYNWKKMENLHKRDYLVMYDEYYNFNYSIIYDYITEIKRVPDELVYDFETESDNHSFVANGIIVHNCGVVKSLSNGCKISIGTDPSDILPILKKMVIPFSKSPKYLGYTKVLLNGDWVGFVEKSDIEKIIKTLKNLKIHCGIHHETSILYDDANNQIRVTTEGGRVITPLLVVKNGQLKITKELVKSLKKGEISWYDLLSKGVVEFIDAEEQNSITTVVANYPSEISKFNPKNKKYTHCDLHPSLMYGAGATTIPYPNHNPAPRCTYQSSMSKQSIGIPCLNYRQIMVGQMHLLHYPQKPLASSKILKLQGYDEMPCGQNVIVAIIPFTGFNQEDSIILNQSSVDRGLFRSSYYVHYEAEDKRDNEIFFEIPNKTECKAFKGKMGVDHLDDDGIVKVGQTVRRGQIIIGKTQKSVDETFKQPKVDLSIVFDEGEYGQVDVVQRGINANGYDYFKIKVIILRIPEIGDKFSSRHSQKGTCGIMYKQEDMPYNPRTGMVPDILVNALAFPSRMTIGQIIENLVGKRCCVSNENLGNDVTEAEIEEKAKEILEKRIEEQKEKCKKMLKMDMNERKKILRQHLKKLEKVTDKEERKKIKENAKRFAGEMTPEMKEKELELLKENVKKIKKLNFDFFQGIAKRELINEKKSSLEKNMKNYKKEHTIGDATPFVGTTKQDLDDHPFSVEDSVWVKACPDNTYIRDTIKTLHSFGYEYTANERLINGMTGEMMEADICMGPTYYQRLKHMVQDKIHARAKGPNQTLTRQPREGRAQNGGVNIILTLLLFENHLLTLSFYHLFHV